MKFSRILLTVFSLLVSTVAGQTVTYTFPNHQNPCMNYGFCVKGASYASATSTSSEYDMVSTNFGNGVRLWGNAESISKDVDGNNNDCKGGIYLQPSLKYDSRNSKATIVATAAAGVSHVQICAFVFEANTRYIINRENWVGLLERDGFDSTPKAFGWSEFNAFHDGGRTLCKNFEVKVDDVPTVLPRPITYTFPSMGDNKIAHGLCVKGAHIASASNTRGIEYDVGSVNFKGRFPLWRGGAPYVTTDLRHHPCLGGIYLQPNIRDIPLAWQSVPDSTNVQIIPASEESTVLLCALLTQEKPSDSMGDWTNLTKTDGFMEYPGSFGVIPSWLRRLRSNRYNNRFLRRMTKPGWTYCKEMSPSPTSSPTVSPTGFPTTLPSTSFPTSDTQDIVRPTNDSLRRGTDAGPNGIRLTRTVGTTEFPLAKEDGRTTAAVNILSRNRTTVTVDLIQAWNGRIDNFFYVYRSGHFSSHCYEKTNMVPGESIDTVTLRCNVLTPTASLYVCVEDRSGSLLGVGDKGSAPDCCNSDAPEDTPTVCYHLEIACETESASGRNLRSIHHRNEKDNLNGYDMP